MAGEVLSDAAFPPDHQVRPLVRNGRGELFTGRQSSRRIGYVAGLYQRHAHRRTADRHRAQQVGSRAESRTPNHASQRDQPAARCPAHEHARDGGIGRNQKKTCQPHPTQRRRR
ncbi:Uncharacterised protein [Mycobacterium tuberculosis]|uniref:Uncharacterized protein n=1 Tax=Mycobacterium tuberculosis TaxID=1773 RepID=A0A655EVL0_MYCTX|nr:Uncharacterised protein [Mycobacterium tuberculosis]CKT96834.1 Uncharacterised protein [Mycobacterium tuberculosis]CNV34946.1 Uncharacterised protein [Mycobacterium tuberculosis]COX04972.1 Uncharacterised protein [Mycobacterium tuberculosis]COX40906.1 Uncharacterised protein [Mycobacterium tuberculosis]